jgi:membrane fusion protein, multidrug efflux system
MNGADLAGVPTHVPRHVSATIPHPAAASRHLFVRAMFALVTVAAMAVILWIAAYNLTPFARGIQTTDDAYIDGHVVYAAPEAAGRVVDVLVDDNAPVTAGQLLVRIDPVDYQAKSEQARGQREQAESQVNQAIAQLKVARSTAAQLHAQVHVVDANLGKAVADLRRYESLSGEGVSKLTLDAAESLVQSTTAQRAAAVATADGADAKAELAETSIATAQAALKAAQGAEQLASLNVSYCELRAPMDGYVARKTVEAGDYVAIGQPLLIVVPKRVYVTANFKETQLADMRSGQRATVTVDAYPGRVFTGHVDSEMAGTGAAFALLPPENATGNFVKVVQRVPVKIVLDTDNSDPAHRLAPGMSVVPSVSVADANQQGAR